MSAKNKNVTNSPDTNIPAVKTIPERQVGHFSTANNTGISVNIEVQLGVDLKDQRLMNDFIARFEKARGTSKPS